MATLSFYLVFFIPCLFQSVGCERNLEAEVDAMKLAFELKIASQQNEINTLKRTIDNVMKDHRNDIATLRHDMDLCLSQSHGINEKSWTPPNWNGTHALRKRYAAGGVYHPTAAFYAYLTHDIENLGTSEKIIFDHVETNIGNVYDDQTGTFTCLVPGTYVFHVHVLAIPHHTVYTILTKNDQETVAYIYASTLDSNYGHGSNTAILHLEKDDFINLKAHDHYTSRGDVIDHYWSSFSGFLLYPKV